jgi:hypothetical protein
VRRWKGKGGCMIVLDYDGFFLGGSLERFFGVKDRG